MKNKSIMNYFTVFCFALSLVAYSPNMQATSPEQQTLIDRGQVRLKQIHAKLSLLHGDLQDEYPEQLMSAIFIPANAKVLEIGANVGRNSCVIASILKNSKNLVSVESNVDYAAQLEENRNLNQLNFSIEGSAISKTPLIQAGWKTKPSAEDIPGWSRITITSFHEIQKKYNIKFDTLVIDCEGALYYILKDFPKMLKNIKLIIIENDFDRIEDMEYVQNIFRDNGLQCVFNMELPGPICGDSFYQVWKKR